MAVERCFRGKSILITALKYTLQRTCAYVKHVMGFLHLNPDQQMWVIWRWETSRGGRKHGAVSGEGAWRSHSEGRSLKEPLWGRGKEVVWYYGHVSRTIWLVKYLTSPGNWFNRNIEYWLFEIWVPKQTSNPAYLCASLSRERGARSSLIDIRASWFVLQFTPLGNLCQLSTLSFCFRPPINSKIKYRAFLWIL